MCPRAVVVRDRPAIKPRASGRSPTGATPCEPRKDAQPSEIHLTRMRWKTWRFDRRLVWSIVDAKRLRTCGSLGDVVLSGLGRGREGPDRLAVRHRPAHPVGVVRDRDLGSGPTGSRRGRRHLRTCTAMAVHLTTPSPATCRRTEGAQSDFRLG